MRSRWTPADEEEYERRYQQQQAAEQAAFAYRGGQPPRRSQVSGPPADWKRWNALLDGKPVGSCWAFDADEGWVEVWVIAATQYGSRNRVANEPRRRLCGTVTPVSNEEWEVMKAAQGGTLDVWQSAPFGEPVPGTEIRPR